MLRASVVFIRVLLAVVLLAAVLGCSPRSPRSGPEWASLKQEIRTKFPQVPHLSVEELDRQLASEEPPLLVDVRPPEEFAVGHLPGAVNASGGQLKNLVAGRQDGQPVVLYCSVGYRSSAAAEELIEDGVGEVYNLEGSIFEWANSGRPVYRGSERVQSVHPYDETWGQLLDESLRSYGEQR